MWRDRNRYPEHNYVPDTFWLLVAALLFAACGLVWLIGQVADHAGPAEGDHRHPGLGGPVQYGGHLRLGPGPQDQVGWVVDAAADAPDQVTIGTAQAVAGPVQRLGGGDRGQRGRSGQPRGWQRPQPGGPLGRLQAEAQQRLDDGSEHLQGGRVRLLARPAPAPHRVGGGSHGRTAASMAVDMGQACPLTPPARVAPDGQGERRREGLPRRPRRALAGR
jgi:hypothetical protein